MCQLLVIPRLHFLASNVLLLCRLGRGRVSSYVFVSPLACDDASSDVPRTSYGALHHHQSRNSWVVIFIIGKRLYYIYVLVRRKSSTLLPIFLGSPVLCLKVVAVGSMNELRLSTSPKPLNGCIIVEKLCLVCISRLPKYILA